MKSIPPAPQPVRYIALSSHATVIKVPPQRRMRIFWSDNATRHIPCAGELIMFQRLTYSMGLWQGYHCTTDQQQIAAILAVAATSRGMIREISPAEFQEKTKIPQETWKIEDYMPEPVAVENLVPTVLPEKCYRKNRIIHCVERHKQRDADSARRVGFAQESWLRLYMTGEVVPCHVWNYKRSAKELGDDRDLPYLKDMLTEGLNRSTHKDDIIMLTNSDTVLHPDIASVIFDYLEEVPAVCSGRVNYAFGTVPSMVINKNAKNWNTDMGGTKKLFDIGRDLFAFRKGFLTKVWNDIPDFVLGEIEWDLVMSVIVKMGAGKKTQKLEDRTSRIAKCELPHGYVWHEDHHKIWLTLSLNNPAKQHNINSMRAWTVKNNLQHLNTLG